MRLLFAFVTIVAAVVLARADDHPLPLSSRPTPQLKLNASIGWRLDAVLRMDEVKGKPVLVIEGDVINDSAQERAAPKVRMGIRDDEGTEILHWTVLTEEPRIKPREWVAFNAKLESPPMDMKILEIQTVEAE
jgi:hypothetical protein